MKTLKFRIASWAIAMFATGTLFAQNVYMFSNCGATGPTGPSQGQINSSYASTNLNGLVTSNGGIQLFTVPAGGNFRIEVFGAQGGNGGSTGGLGAYMSGEFTLIQGQVLKVVVGQRGLNGDYVGGGGGGSFVTDINNVPLIIAGGGGGSYYSSYSFGAAGMAGTVSPSGNEGIEGWSALVNTPGGTNGSGGMAGPYNTWGGQGAGGGGLLTNGAEGFGYPNAGGRAFVNGAGGGLDQYSGTYAGSGGFGGGGAGEWWDYTGAGGGGGYSGGGGGFDYGCGGGGGSFNAGISQNNTSGTNSGHGRVVFTELCNVNITPSKNPICQGESVTLTTNAIANISWGNLGSNPSVNVQPSTTTTYVVSGEGTASPGCTNTAIMVVTVNPLPVLAAVVNPSVLCIGKDATVTLSGANTYTWSGSNLTGSVVMVNPVSDTYYNYSGANGFGCVSSTSVSVVVNTNTLTVSSATSVCAGAQVQISASGANTYTWNTGSLFANTFVSPATNTTYSVSGTDQHNCIISNAVSVNVNPLPNVTAVSDKNSICRGESVTLSAAGADTYVWSNGATASSLHVTLAVDVIYHYTVTGTSSNGCRQSAVVSVAVSRCTGIDEQVTANLITRVYPNPATESIMVELAGHAAASIHITDVTGRIVFSQPVSADRQLLDISTLASGIYYIRVSSEQATDVMKVVKQ